MGLTKLPPMGNDDSGASLAVLLYLNRRPIWKQLRENTQAEGRRLSIYSFRHHLPSSSMPRIAHPAHRRC